MNITNTTLIKLCDIIVAGMIGIVIACVVMFFNTSGVFSIMALQNGIMALGCAASIGILKRILVHEKSMHGVI